MDENHIQKILIVDDDPYSIYLIQRFLKFDNVQIESAQSGMEALELIKKTTFTLFILDIMMKEMDGFELAQTIRNIKKYKYTPIIFITAFYTDPSDIFKGYQTGAFDYLIKPVNKTILYQKVKIFLELDKQKQEIIEQRNKLIENQIRFFDFANSLADWIWEIDKDDKYIFVSDKIKEVMGYDSGEIIGKTPFELMTKDNAKKIKSKFEKIKSKSALIIDLVNWNLTKTGKPICILTNGVPFFDNKNQLIGYRGVHKDITEQKKAEDNNILCLISGEDNERKRIASDLHDGLGQILTASSLNFNNLKKNIKCLNEKKQNQYNSGLAFLNEAIKEIRNIAHNLMPNAIEHFGLISAITSLLNSVKKNSDFEISISENIGNKRLDKQIEINMYRITQEILNNAIKHSKAKNVTFQYQIYENDFIFTYEDDGIGFDIEKTKLKEKCQGLNNITNRVKSMSGFISINSKIGKGTSISIEMII